MLAWARKPVPAAAHSHNRHANTTPKDHNDIFKQNTVACSPQIIQQYLSKPKTTLDTQNLASLTWK